MGTAALKLLGFFMWFPPGLLGLGNNRADGLSGACNFSHFVSANRK